MDKSRQAPLIALALGFTVVISGCASVVPTPLPTATPAAPVHTPTSTEPATPAGPAIVEGGTAKENQPYFDKVNLDFFAANGTGTSLGIVESLAAAGFRKQDMQVTADHTSIDLVADSIIVSVRLKGQCLIGDFQASGYKSIVAPILGTGGCLIGTTVPIQ
ncbi:MAG: hypothetical protein KF761_11695 [Salinibacterium sp.]|nr:hypothetical protein [Salinibacterium sp.]